MEENAHAVKENKEDIGELKKEMTDLRKENIAMRQQCLEHARYKRRWDLRLIGLPEKENENARESVIGTLTRVIPWSVEKLRQSVDTVHCLGKRNNAARNKLTRSVIIQFALQTVRGEVWKKHERQECVKR